MVKAEYKPTQKSKKMANLRVFDLRMRARLVSLTSFDMSIVPPKHFTIQHFSSQGYGMKWI